MNRNNAIVAPLGLTDYFEIEAPSSSPKTMKGALDIGNYGTKGVYYIPTQKGTGPTQWKLIFATMPSQIAFGVPEMFQYDETLAGRLIHIISTNGQDVETNYVVNAPAGMPTGSRSYQFSEARAALGYAITTQALSPYTSSTNGRITPPPITLGVTMMMGQYYDGGMAKSAVNIGQLNELMSRKFRLGPGHENCNNVSFQGQKDIVVLAETLATSVLALRDEFGVQRELYLGNDAKIKPGNKFMVLDVGYKDATLLVVQVSPNHTPQIQSYKTTYDISVSQLAKNLESLVRAEIQKKSRRASDLRVASGRQLIQLESYQVFDQEFDLRPLKAALIRGMDATLKAFVSDEIGDANDLSTAWVTGGYVELARQALGDSFFKEGGDSALLELNNLYIPAHPEYTNAQGTLATIHYRSSNK